jgi:hypothetical protein
MSKTTNRPSHRVYAVAKNGERSLGRRIRWTNSMPPTVLIELGLEARW